MEELMKIQFAGYRPLSSKDWKPLHNKIPAGWHLMLSYSKNKWKDLVLDLWSPFFRKLPKFGVAMKKQLVDVAFIEYSGSYFIVYCFEYKGKQFLYAGCNPFGAKENPLTTNFPKTLQDFYKELHNGFFLHPVMCFGPLPLMRCFVLSSERWGFLENNPAGQLPCKLENHLVIFSNGGGGYLCLDVSKKLNENCDSLIWWNDEMPDREKFWPVLDAWMEIGIRD